MFSVQSVRENGFDKLILKDGSGGCYCELIPSCGASLHAFGVKTNDKNVQVIDHYESEKQFKEEVEPLGYKSCKLAPFVCRLRDSTYSFEGEKYTIQTNPDRHALHGLLYKKPFNVENTNADDQHAVAVLSYHYDNEDPGYPFRFDCIITYELKTGNRLRLKTEYVNHSGKAMPVQDGWHPYFTLGKKVDDLELQFHSESKLIFDDQLMPTGAKVRDDSFDHFSRIGSIHLDNCFVLDENGTQPMCVLRNRESRFEVCLFPEPSYPYLQIYTPSHRNSIAIENLSGPPNAFNLGYGFTTLNDGQSVSFETAYQISFLN
ncbi:MAG: aldose 1-epimerase [Chitinophagaceae bacterium]|nr:aldose 1-epimerase [Chitinophagaceae bacterium]